MTVDISVFYQKLLLCLVYACCDCLFYYFLSVTVFCDLIMTGIPRIVMHVCNVVSMAII